MKKITSLIASVGALSPLTAFAIGGVGNVTTPPVVTDVTSVQDFYQIILIAAQWLVVFGLIIGAVFVIWGGIQYVTAGGDEGEISSAKSKIIGALIGIALVLLAFALVNIVGSFFTGSSVVTP